MSGALDPTLKLLDDCGCCQGTAVQTPLKIYNRPGLSAIAYRVGTHSRFKESMLAALSNTRLRPALADLRTRDDDDFSIALLDAWATIADVLTFYQERIANESYLRTATERRSIAYLGELIGYRLKPGVAATAYLSFSVDKNTATAQINQGTQVKSLPTDGDLPQTFETIEAITARYAWNQIQPRTQQSQQLASDTRTLILDGMDWNIKVGDSLLIFYRDNSQIKKMVQKVFTVQPDPMTKTTRIDFEFGLEFAPQYFPFVTLQPRSFLHVTTPLTKELVENQMLGKSWSGADLLLQAAYQGWAVLDLNLVLQAVAKQAALPTDTGSFVFRKRAAVFGHNAPKYSYVEDNLPTNSVDDWEGRTLLDDAENKYYLYLDSVYPEITTSSWIALNSPASTQGPLIYQVENVEEISRADYTLSARITRLTLDRSTGFGNFPIRETEVLVQSEELDLAQVPISDAVDGETLQLAEMIDFQGLKSGKKLILSGKPVDNPYITQQEVAEIDEVRVENGILVLEFTKSLIRSYLRDSVVLYVNVAEATQGETQTEVLGSGNGSQPRQTFNLAKNPLTYISAATASGSQSTLQVRVDGLEWKEVPDLAHLKPNDRSYIVRINDDGKTHVIFGDGKHGVLPPTGQENISASYRSGIGLKGNLGVDTLTLLSKRPPGIREVTNPLPASGGADGESAENARRNAPLSVLTLDRVVSLQDYEDFARAYAGIDKALATRAWQGQTQAVHLTVSGPKGAAINQGVTTYQNLLTSIQGASPAGTPTRIQSFSWIFFQIKGKILVAGDYQRKKVLADLDQKLRAHFSYLNREFGQSVSISEVMAVIQSLPGVSAVDVDALFRGGESESWNPLLPAARPKPGSSLTSIQPAELLTLDPRPMQWGEMK